MVILMEIGELRDFPQKDPVHWVNVLVFCLVVVVVLIMGYTMRPTLVRLEDSNSAGLQVVERNGI